MTQKKIKSKLKKSEIALEELVRIIIFLFSLVVISIIFSKILIPKIFEKNAEIFCKKYVSLKNDDNIISSNLFSYLVSPTCVEVKRELKVNNKEELKFYLINYISKICEITKFNKKELELCLYNLKISASNTITLKKEEVKDLITYKNPINNEYLYETCSGAIIQVESDIIIDEFGESNIKICYDFEKEPYILIKN